MHAEKWVYPSGVTERAYQVEIIQTALLHNTLVCLPTGLGKTLIAAVVMHNFARWFPEVRKGNHHNCIVKPIKSAKGVAAIVRLHDWNRLYHLELPMSILLLIDMPVIDFAAVWVGL